jgi:hypothetical protein
MRLELSPEEINGETGHGLEIAVRKFPKFEEAQIYVEFYDGKLRVHVWDDSQEDPIATVEVYPGQKSIHSTRRQHKLHRGAGGH